MSFILAACACERYGTAILRTRQGLQQVLDGARLRAGHELERERAPSPCFNFCGFNGDTRYVLPMRTVV